MTVDTSPTMSPVTQPAVTDPNVAIAILFERVGHLIEKVDALSEKMDESNAKRTRALADLESRVVHIERQMTSVRWFLAGVAAGGGALGGGIAAMVANMLGG